MPLYQIVNPVIEVEKIDTVNGLVMVIISTVVFLCDYYSVLIVVLYGVIFAGKITLVKKISLTEYILFEHGVIIGINGPVLIDVAGGVIMVKEDPVEFCGIKLTSTADERKGADAKAGNTAEKSIAVVGTIDKIFFI